MNVVHVTLEISSATILTHYILGLSNFDIWRWMLHKIGEGEERGGRRMKEERTFDSFSHSNISLLSDVFMTKMILA